MSEDTNQPGLKDAIDEQAKIIVSLQSQLKTAIERNSAEDSNQFAQAVLAATQTWRLLVDTWDEIKPKPFTTRTIQSAQPAATYQAIKTWKKAP